MGKLELLDGLPGLQDDSFFLFELLQGFRGIGHVGALSLAFFTSIDRWSISLFVLLLLMVMGKETVADQRLAVNAVVASEDALDLFPPMIDENPPKGSEAEFPYLAMGTIVACESREDVLKGRRKTGQPDIFFSEIYHRRAVNFPGSSKYPFLGLFHLFARGWRRNDDLEAIF